MNLLMQRKSQKQQKQKVLNRTNKGDCRKAVVPFLKQKKMIMKKNFFKLLSFLCPLVFLTGCVEGGISADEWIIAKYDTLPDIQSYCTRLDDVVALYLSDGITQEMYLTNIKDLELQLSEMEILQEKGSIKPGTFTELTMAAKEGYDDIWSSLNTLVSTMQSDNTVLEDKAALSYLYLAYQEQLQSDMEKFVAGYNEAAGGKQ